MNSARDNEKRTDDDHEGHIIDSRVNDARGLVNNKKMIQTNYTGESDAKLVVMTLPMTLSDERTECDRHQQDHKRHHDRPVRKCRGEAQNRNHPVIGLIVVPSVNKTRLCRACSDDWFKDSDLALISFRTVCPRLASARQLRS